MLSSVYRGFDYYRRLHGDGVAFDGRGGSAAGFGCSGAVAAPQGSRPPAGG
ncbi:MAG: hypothetical protein ACM3PD_00650 [Chloroflexota bacterium]